MRKFTRTIEDFTCKNCGTHVAGNGYTNHCPSCLYSKHVDVNPGDRKSDCKGTMIPIAAETSKEGYIITHRCQKCGHIKRNKSATGDNVDAIIEITRQQSHGGVKR